MTLPLHRIDGRMERGVDGGFGRKIYLASNWSGECSSEGCRHSMAPGGELRAPSTPAHPESPCKDGDLSFLIGAERQFHLSHWPQVDSPSFLLVKDLSLEESHLYNWSLFELCKISFALLVPF